MFFFEGASCPVCNIEFDEKSDIVTCPVCGTPHHRNCYFEHGECANSERHEESFVWSAPAASEDPDYPQQDGTKTVKCRVCGFENPDGMLYCRKCSSPLFLDENGRAPAYNSDMPNGQQNGGGYYSFGSSAFTVSDNELIGDVTVGDLKHYIGNSWYYYVSVFYNLFNTGKKISFNFLAFLTNGMWFIVRKMYLLGSLLFAAMLAADVFQVMHYDFLMNVYDLMQKGSNDAAMAAIAAQPVVSAILFGTSIMKYVIMFISGLLGNRIYMNHCIRNIKRLGDEQLSRESYCAVLEEKGGVSLAGGIICVVLYFIIQYYLSSLL